MFKQMPSFREGPGGALRQGAWDWRWLTHWTSKSHVQMKAGGAVLGPGLALLHTVPWRPICWPDPWTLLFAKARNGVSCFS